MKSQLLSAELTADGLAEDVFLLAPRGAGDQSVRLALTHLHAAETLGDHAVVLLHGQFANRGCWYRREGDDLASHLASRGMDVWMPEMRGHGFSPANDGYRRNRIEDYASIDIPAWHTFLTQRHDYHSVTWVAYGLGAWSLMLAIRGGLLPASSLTSVVLVGLDDVGLPGTKSRLTLWNRMALRKKGVVPLPAEGGLNAEPEPLSVLEFDARKAAIVGPDGGVSSTLPAVFFIDGEPEGVTIKHRSVEFVAQWPGAKNRRCVLPCRAWPMTSDRAALKALEGLLVQWLRAESRLVSAVEPA